MMSTDLLRQQQKWKDSMMDIRQIMTNLVQQVKEINAFVIGFLVELWHICSSSSGIDEAVDQWWTRAARSSVDSAEVC